MRLSLRTRILLLVSTTIAGLCGLFLLAVSVFAANQFDHLVKADLRTTRSVLTAFISERARRLLDESRLLVSQPVLRPYLQAADRATLQDLCGTYQKKVGADGAIVTDRRGITIAESGGIKGQGPDAAPFPGIPVALASQEWSGTLVRGGHLLLATTVPALIGGEVWGTFSTFTEVDSKLAMQLRPALPPGGQVAFVRNRQVIASSFPLPGELDVVPETPTRIATRSGPFVALFAPLPGSAAADRLGFVVLHPYAVLSILGGTFTGGLAAACTLLIGAALAAGLLVARNITEPVFKVVKAAKALQEGGWPEPLAIEREDEIGRLQGAFNSMSRAMRESHERLLGLIDTDLLTGLDNHRRFQERLSQETNRCSASGEPLSILLLDLDDFNEFNLRNGHAAGDRALTLVAETLREITPGTGVCSRFGGEEFAVILPGVTLPAAAETGDRIRLALESRREAEEGCTVSIGCASLDGQTVHADGLLLASEIAVARAKQLGKNRVCDFGGGDGDSDFGDPARLHKIMKNGSLATIQALAAAVDAKDAYTHGHSRRVAEYAMDLARRLNLPEEECQQVYIAGTLHDVGKIGVPDAILQKQGPLTPEERAVIETHPVLGEVIVRKAPQLERTLPGVRLHHERWDGSGYPDGLKGAETPLIARILAVADAFDAMTSSRPYRNGRSVEATLEEILRISGTQLDPELATAFVTMMRLQAPALAVTA